MPVPYCSEAITLLPHLVPTLALSTVSQFSSKKPACNVATVDNPISLSQRFFTPSLYIERVQCKLRPLECLLVVQHHMCHVLIELICLAQVLQCLLDFLNGREEKVQARFCVAAKRGRKLKLLLARAQRKLLNNANDLCLPHTIAWVLYIA